MASAITIPSLAELRLGCPPEAAQLRQGPIGLVSRALAPFLAPGFWLVAIGSAGCILSRASPEQYRHGGGACFRAVALAEPGIFVFEAGL